MQLCHEAQKKVIKARELIETIVQENKGNGVYLDYNTCLNPTNTSIRVSQ